MIVGAGLVFTNNNRLKSFEKSYNEDKVEFVNSELARAEKTINEFENAVFKVISIIIIVAALLILFINKDSWRAACITTILMMACILLVDGNSSARMEVYKSKLIEVKG